MNDADAQALPLRIVSEPPSPRFLGLTVDERNARVMKRAAATGTLIVPPGVAITPALVQALPRANGVWHLVWDSGRPPIVWTANGDTSTTASTARVAEGLVFDVSTRAARRQASWRLLRASGKPTDGWLARHIHRRISRVFSYVLLRLGLKANHATFLTLLVGVVCAWLVAQTSRETFIAGCLVFWFASIADGIDGEMARLTLTESEWGEQLDTAVDFATFLLCYVGILVGWWRQGIGPAGWTLGVGTAVAVLITVFWGMHVVRRARDQHDRVFVDTKPIEIGVRDAARATGAPMLRLAAATFVLFRREAFSLSFVALSLITGWRGVIVLALLVGLAIVSLTLIVYGTPIERAIRARNRAGV